MVRLDHLWIVDTVRRTAYLPVYRDTDFGIGWPQTELSLSLLSRYLYY